MRVSALERERALVRGTNRPVGLPAACSSGTALGGSAVLSAAFSRKLFCAVLGGIFGLSGLGLMESIESF